MYKLNLFLLAVPLSACASEYQIATYFDSHSFSNIVPIKDIVEDEWKNQPSKNSNIGFSQSIAGVKYTHNNFSLSTLHRLDYFIDTNSDTADAYFKNVNKLSLNSLDPYDIFLSFSEQKSKGISIGYKYTDDNWSSEVELFYWDVSRFRQSKLVGSINGNNNKLLGELSLKESYTHKNFLKRSNEQSWNANGYGKSVNVNINYSHTDYLHFKLSINDIYNKFLYRNLGYTNANINTNGSFIDNKGFSSFRPLIRGVESASDKESSLPRSFKFEAKLQEKNINYTIDIQKRASKSFYLLGISKIYKHLEVALKYDFDNETPELQVKTPWLKIQIAADSSNLNKVKNLKLGLNFNINF